jgi:hypothetical protein
MACLLGLEFPKAIYQVAGLVAGASNGWSSDECW